MGNIIHVARAGTIYSVLEQASVERLDYYQQYLSQDATGIRPSHTHWFVCPEVYDKYARSPLLTEFSKINLFWMGAVVRKLQRRIPFSDSDVPESSKCFSSREAAVLQVDLLRWC